MDNTSNTIGDRLSEVLSHLKRLKKISGDRDIADQLEYRSTSSITEVKKGRATPSKELLDLLSRKYKVSTQYILEGTGTAFNDPTQVKIEDYERKTIAKIINIDAKCDVILSALAEVLAKQNGQLARTVWDQMKEKIDSLTQDMNEEL